MKQLLPKCIRILALLASQPWTKETTDNFMRALARCECEECKKKKKSK